MGGSGSKLEKVLGTGFPENERYFGLENFGNTCYCNSVLQALYFCLPFRHHCIKYLATAREKAKENPNPSNQEEDHLLQCLCDLFAQISNSKKRTGAIPPKNFVAKLRKENEVFRGLRHQDAHEFLNYLLNTIHELLQAEMKEEEEKKEKSKPRSTQNDTKKSPIRLNGDDIDERARMSQSSPNHEPMRTQVKAKSTQSLDPNTPPHHPADSTVPQTSLAEISMHSLDGYTNNERKSKSGTFVHELFEGQLSSETRCLTCETVTSREESFLDLSVDVQPNSSVHHCLKNFSSSETLACEDKFFCDHCCCLQEAQKCIRIRRAPNVLAIHLKRFKYINKMQTHKKLSYRVSFSHQLRVPVMGEEDADTLYHLFAVVVHVGSGPNMGHYVSMVKSHDHWLLFDDDVVEQIPENSINSVFGVTGTGDFTGTTQTGYLLLYSLNDCATNPDSQTVPMNRNAAHAYQART